MIDTRLLTFINLSKLKNYTRTAEALHMTQPAVTQHIKFLEDHYDTKLFYRHEKEYLLTQKGEVLLEYALKMFHLSDKTDRLLRGSEELPKKYRLGATLTIGGYLLPEHLIRYKEKYPLTELSLAVKNTEDILRDLQREAIDIALIEGDFPREKFDSRLFKIDELIVVASPESPLSLQREFSLSDLASEGLILREPGSGTRDYLDYKLRTLGIDLASFNVTMEVGDLNAIKTLVQAGAGTSIISREVVKNELLEGSLIHIPIPGLDLHREFNFVYRKGVHADEFIDEFIGFCISSL